jgi:hypothetical protein
MSLLDSDDDPYEEEHVQTGEPFFGDTSHSKGKAKKSRGEDKKGKPLHWSKQKENVVLEKTSKRVKGQSSAKSSVSKTPPDSPKSVRPLEVKGGKGGVVLSKGGVVQPGLLPSPNVKNQRKRYSQLSGASSSSEEDLAAKEGSLFSNKPALRGDGGPGRENPLDTPTNPFLDDRPLVPGVGYTAPVLGPSLFSTGAEATMFSDVQELAWLPTKHHSLDHTSTPNFLSDLSSTLGPPGHTPSVVSSAANPLLMVGEAGELVSSPPQDGGGLQTNPFLPTNQFSGLAPGFIVPPPPTTTPPGLSPPMSASPTHTDAAEGWVRPASSPPISPSPPPVATADDWTISEDLHSKCVQQFNSLEPVKGLLLGGKAREFFVQSKLPNQELSAIW